MANPIYLPGRSPVLNRERWCRATGGHDLDINAARCRRCFLAFRTLDLIADRVGLPAAEVPVSDHGLIGALPLEPTQQPWESLDDADWAAQNRKINDLLAGRG